MRAGDIPESGAIIGGRSISNVRYTNETALSGTSPQEINQHSAQGKLCQSYVDTLVNSLGILEQHRSLPASETIMWFPYSRLTFVTSTRFGKRDGSVEQ